MTAPPHDEHGAYPDLLSWARGELDRTRWAGPTLNNVEEALLQEIGEGRDNPETTRLHHAVNRAIVNRDRQQAEQIATAEQTETARYAHQAAQTWDPALPDQPDTNNPQRPTDTPLVVTVEYDGARHYATIHNGQRLLTRTHFRPGNPEALTRTIHPRYRMDLWEHMPHILHQAAQLEDADTQTEGPLTVEYAEHLLRGGLDTMTPTGIVLPVPGDDGLVYARDGLGKSRFLRSQATQALQTARTVLAVIGEDLTGWAAYGLHHRPHMQNGQLTILPAGRLPDDPTEAHLILLDPASEYITDQDGGENLKANVKAYFRQIKELWPESVRITAHHENKATEEPSGSAEWLNSPAVVWRLHFHTAPDGENIKLLTHRKRRHADPPDPIVYATTPWGIRPLGTTRDERDDQIVKAVELICAMKPPASLTNIGNHIRPKPTHTELAALVDRGRLEKVPLAGSANGGYKPAHGGHQQLPAPY